MNLQDLLVKYLGDYPDAYNFAASYILFCHAVDDIVDEPKPSAEHILKTWDLATVVFCNPFYIQHNQVLAPTIRAACNLYADSVDFEKHQDWRKRCADTLRHSGNMVTVAVIEIVAGYDAKREASKMLHELSYQHHKGDLVND